MERKQENIAAEAAPPAPSSPLLELVRHHRRAVCGWLTATGAVLAIVAAVLSFGPWSVSGLVKYDLIAGAAVCLLSGAWPFFFPPAGAAEEKTYARLIVLVTGGLLGLAIALGGMVFAWAWWDVVYTWINPNKTGENGDLMLIVLLMLLGGLAIMFVSFQLARTEERRSILMRRTLYGYNAGLNGLLLLSIVAVLTIMLSVKFQAPLDFTAAGDFTLSPKSINILRSLTVPVNVTFIHGFSSQNQVFERQVATLLDNCRNYTDKLDVKDLFPWQEQNAFRELAKKYPAIDFGSLLLVYKRPGNDKEDFRVITENDLSGTPDFSEMGRGRTQKFNGEDALISALNALAEDKELPTVYFTQGHRELDTADSLTTKTNTACGALKRRLEQRKTFEVKTLTFDAINPTVPAKAAVVAIIGPRGQFSAAEVKALRDYVNHGGKLLLMLDAVVGSDKQMVKTGLEEFLAEYSVGLPSERLVTLPNTQGLPATLALVSMNDKFIQQNRLVQAFSDDGFLFPDGRPVQSLAERPGGRFLTMPLMIVAPFTFADADLTTDPGKKIQDLRANREEFNKKVMEIQARIKKDGPIAVAVAVTEPGNDPHAGIAGPADPKPRMVVIGSAGWAANPFMDDRSPVAQQYPQHFELLYSAFEWLRGKEHNIGIDPKVNRPFTLGLKSDTEKQRIVWLPPVLILGCVFGLATGVWIVRRR